MFNTYLLETGTKQVRMEVEDRFTCIFPVSPELSIRLATLTVSPQMSYCGFFAPMTPAMTGP